MKKRILAFLLAVSIAVSVLVLPVSAAQHQQHGPADGYYSGRCAHRSGA